MRHKPLFAALTTLANIKPRLQFIFRTTIVVAAISVLVVTAMAQATETVLSNFRVRGQKGSLIRDNQGNLYGTTEGTAKQYGTVYELRHQKSGRWTSKVIYRFKGGQDGAYPQSGLVFDSAGNLYGTTLVGGVNNCNWSKTKGCGTVFELTPTAKAKWAEKVLFDFPDSSGAAIPINGLFPDQAGNLYGATALGGSVVLDGAIFRMVPQPGGSWSEQHVYAFTDSEGGVAVPPGNPLVADGAGNIYGVTTSGGKGLNCVNGTGGCGNVFELSPGGGGWTYNEIYSFCTLPDCADGAFPNGVILDGLGNLYGTTSANASQTPSNGGTAFELSPSGGNWGFNLLYSFCSLEACTDGSHPSGALVRDSSGNLYGPTITGGATFNAGVIFQISPQPSGSWNFNVMYEFCQTEGCPGGLEPIGQLALDGAGDLFGTTPNLVFEIQP